jgi:preprotein translocase subunit SecF
MIDFLKYKMVYAAISAAMILIGLFSIITWGFDYSIEFTGGTNMQYRIEPPKNEEQIKGVLESLKIPVNDVSIDKNVVSIRTPSISDKQEVQVRNKLQSDLKTEITVLKSETVGASLSEETVRKTFIAAGMAILGILLYIAWSFKNLTFAIAAVVALFHDVFIVIGAYSLMSHFFGAELDTLFVTAALTTMSFSVHDTIVMFDQLRHNLRKFGTSEVEHYANVSITETFVRSINNSMTVVFMLLALVLLGGETVKWFVLSLLVGTLVGTYSSPFVAMNLVVWLLRKKKS